MAQDPRSPFSSSHPLAGKISAGVRTTENRARRANQHQSMHMAQMPVLTTADRAQQMFSIDDKKGTRVYYANSGVFNTVDDKGSSINFIKGLFKTTDRSVIRFLQYFVDRGHIDYLELKEDATDVGVQEQPKRSDGGIVGDAGEQQHQPEPEQRDETAPEPDRSGPGGEGQEHAEQPIERAASSEPDTPAPVDPEPASKPSALDLIRRAKK